MLRRFPGASPEAREWYRLAYTDALTALQNRNAYNRYVQEAFLQADRQLYAEKQRKKAAH